MKKATRIEIESIKSLLLQRYGDALTELHYSNIFELIIAVALSAQCTDKRVNLITPNLFKKFPTPSRLANANLDDVKELIRSCSFFNNKAINLISMAKRIVENYGGEVPIDEKELITEYIRYDLQSVQGHEFTDSENNK